jgi:hypothetical protein
MLLSFCFLGFVEGKKKEHWPHDLPFDKFVSFPLKLTQPTTCKFWIWAENVERQEEEEEEEEKEKRGS